jgi:ribulose-5-phosphate 4-epimerase/fuculose-1-phosphate aldolase
MENYAGTRFNTIYLNNEFSYPEKLQDLIHWCKLFTQKGLAPGCAVGFAGNLSFRTKVGFVITGAGVDLSDTKESDFVEVVDISNLVVSVNGVKEPSSESMLHNEIYKTRSDIKAIFHGHSKQILDFYAEKYPITKLEKPYGSIDLVKQVITILDQNDFVLMRNHGFLSFGKNMQEAGDQVINLLTL